MSLLSVPTSTDKKRKKKDHQIDFFKISEFEGTAPRVTLEEDNTEYIRAYHPGKDFPSSGVTLGDHGLDAGKETRASMKKMGVQDSILDKLTFAGAYGLKGDAAQKAANGIFLTNEENANINKVTQSFTYGRLQKQFREEVGQDFESYSAGEQTVAASITNHFGKLGPKMVEAYKNRDRAAIQNELLDYSYIKDPNGRKDKNGKLLDNLLVAPEDGTEIEPQLAFSGRRIGEVDILLNEDEALATLPDHAGVLRQLADNTPYATSLTDGTAIAESMQKQPDEFQMAQMKTLDPDEWARDWRRRQAESLSPETLNTIGTDPEKMKKVAKAAPQVIAAETAATLNDNDEYFLDIGRLLQGHVVKTAGAGLRSGKTLFNIIDKGIRAPMNLVLTQLGFGDFVEVAKEMQDDYRGYVPWWLKPTEVLGRPGDILDEAADDLFPTNDLDLFQKTIGQFGQVGAQVALWLANPALSYTTMFQQGKDSVDDIAKEHGLDPDDFQFAGVMGGVLTAATERYGLDKIFKFIPANVRNRFLRMLSSAGVEGAQEIVENIGHDLIGMGLISPDHKIDIGEIGEAGFIGAVIGGTIGALLPGRGRPVKHKRAMDAVVTAMEESGIVQEDPDLAAELRVEIVKKKGYEWVEVPSQKLLEWMGQTEEGFAAMVHELKLTEQMAGIMQGANARISGHDLANILMGHKNYSSIATHIEFEAGFPSSQRVEDEILENKKKLEEMLEARIKAKTIEPVLAARVSKWLAAFKKGESVDLEEILLGASRSGIMAELDVMLDKIQQDDLGVSILLEEARAVVLDEDLVLKDKEIARLHEKIDEATEAGKPTKAIENKLAKAIEQQGDIEAQISAAQLPDRRAGLRPENDEAIQPDEVTKSRSVFKIVKGAIGITPNQIEGANREETPTRDLSPDEFLELAEAIAPEQVKGESVEFLEEAIRDGKPIAPPFLTLQWNITKNQWKVVGHEGRHRAMAAKKAGLKSLPVQIFLRNGNGNRITDPDALLKGEGLLSQGGKRVALPKVPKLKAQRSDSIKMKAGRLLDLGVAIERTRMRETRKAFTEAKSLVKKDIQLSQKTLRNLITKSGLNAPNQARFLKQIDTITDSAVLAKKLPDIQVKVMEALDRQRKADIISSIKQTLGRYKAKVDSTTNALRGKAGFRDTKTTDLITVLSKHFNMKKADASLLLEQRLSGKDGDGLSLVLNTDAKSLDSADMLDEEARLINALLTLKANPTTANADFVEGVLLGLSDIVDQGVERSKSVLFKEEIQQESTRVNLIKAIGEEPTKARSTLAVSWSEKKGKWWLGPSGVWKNKLGDIMSTSDANLAEEIQSVLSLTREARVAEENRRRSVQRITEILMKNTGLSEQQILKQQQKDFTESVPLGQSFTFADTVDADGNIISNGQIKEVLGANGKPFTKSQLRQRVMELENDDIRAMAMDSQNEGYTTQIHDAMKAQMDKLDWQMIRAQQEFYNEFYERINKVYQRMYGVTLPKVDQYVPISRLSEDGSQDEFLKGALYRGLINPSALKQRTKNNSRLKVRADFEVMQTHLMEMEYFIAYAEKVKFINKVFSGNNSEVMRRILETSSQPVHDTIRRDIEYFANKGVMVSQTGEDVLVGLMRNFSFAQLGLKPQIGLKQLASFSAFSENVKMTDFLKGLTEFLANPKKAIKFLNENSTFFKNRGIKLDHDFQQLVESKQGHKIFNFMGRNPTFTKVVMKAITLGDAGAIAFGGYAHIRALEKQGMSTPDAILKFEQLSNDTQQSTDPDKVSELQRSSSYGRLLVQFMSGANAIARGELRAITEMGKGRITKKEFMKRFFVYHFFIPNLISFIANGFDYDKEDMLQASILGSWNGLFLLGDALVLANAALSTAYRDDPETGFDLEGRHPLQLMKTAALFAKEMAKEDWSSIEWEDFIDGVKALEYGGELAGMVSGVPIEQFMNEVKGFDRLIKGDTKTGLALLLGYSPWIIEQRGIGEDE
jgi:hypothetical protein